MASNNDDVDYPTGRSVPFPFESPYPQQVDFMDTLLSSLRNSTKVLLMESPTGTGKSLSLACSAMAWLRYQEAKDLENKASSSQETKKTAHGSTADSWLEDWVDPEEQERQHQDKIMKERARSSRQALEEHLLTLRTKLTSSSSNNVDGKGLATKNHRERRENLVRSAVTTAKMRERQGMKKVKKQKFVAAEGEEDYCVADYKSDNEDVDDWTDLDKENDYSSVNDAVQQASELLQGSALDGSSAVYSSQAVGGVVPGSGLRKIVYAARTHSQLSQFVGELRRTHFADARVVALGGRQVLCGNSDINRPGRSEQSINDACLDLQKDKKFSCPLLTSKEGLATLALHTLVQPSDIEDAASLGKASHACSYYASRKSLASAEVVVLPYSMLLSKTARQAVGLSLKESLVLVDEAHNLPEAIRSLHSCRLPLPVAQAALDQLAAYTRRYADRLTGRNLYYLGQLRKCLKAFIQHLQQENAHGKPSNMISAAELLMDLKLDNINLFKVLSYLDHSRLPQKLLGFTNAITAKLVISEDCGISKHVSSLSVVQTFLAKMTCTSQEGKIVTDWPRANADSRSSAARHPTLRFVALHPALHFRDVVSEARAVALVGGTIRPFSHVATELLDSNFLSFAANADNMVLDDGKVSAAYSSQLLAAFTCDHVVPASNVLLECLSTGPSNISLDFRHQSRNTDSVMDELGRVVVQFVQTVPAGIVMFLPSYAYEAQVVRRWKARGIWSEIQRFKRVHREPKQRQHVETTLEAYSRDAKEHGALLLSVVGGKMSEGINFANEMARCVVVVGLPYPDITDPELKEKMKTMDQIPSGISGQAYYHNLCMRAVNQSVGRAIRHEKDYAVVILVDQRYSTDTRVWNALPEWLKRGGKTDRNHQFDESKERLARFFDDRRAASEDML